MSDDEEEPRKKLVPVGIKLPEELIEEIRDAAYWCRITVNEILADGAAEYLSKLRKRHNDGKPFEKRARELPKSGGKKKKKPAE